MLSVSYNRRREQISGDMLQARWLLIEQAQSVLPMTFLVVLLFWLTMLHLSFGLFAPRNWTVITVLLISALSVSGAIFIILEMNHPLQRHDQSFERTDAQGPGTSGPIAK